MESRSGRAFVAVLATVLCAAAPAVSAVLRVDRNAPGVSTNGQSWSSAYKTINAALGAARSGDEVWVAPGVYHEHLAVPSDVALYGGFIGVEARRDQRRGMPDLSVIETDTADACVTFAPGAKPDTVLDGFTIRGSLQAGGIVCNGGSPTITRNVIRNNGDEAYRAQQPGSGAAGIYGSGPDAVISSNILIANRGNAVSGLGHISHNTIAANNGAGLAPADAGVSFDNNIVAGNLTGISPLAAGVLFHNNCVWGNTIQDYPAGEDLTGTNGNISADPRFAAPMAGNYHLQADSPCVDAALSSADGPDVDLQPRPFGSGPDIGADESDGRTWSDTPYIVRVATTGNDANDGSTWDRAKRTVSAALAAAQDGTEIWVATGTYASSAGFTLPAFVSLHGGFAGTETSLDGRDPAAHQVILSRLTTGHVLTATGGNRVSALDGFTLTPSGAETAIGGIWCEGSSPIIQRNVLQGLVGGPGLYLIGGATAAPLITDNTIRDNPMDSSGTGAVFFSDGSAPDLQRNVFLGNTTEGAFGSPIVGVKASPRARLRNNVFAGNQPSDAYGWIHAVSVDAVEVVNNTFVSNSGPFGSIGTPRAVQFANNIFVDCPGAPPTGGFNNCYWRSGDVSASRGVDGNIEADPMFVDAGHGDYRLLPASPCRDAGLNAVVWAGETDADGSPRIVNQKVDIGAYEVTALPTLDATRRALAIAGGMDAATPADAMLDVDGAPGISIRDAASLLRAGLL